MTPKLVFTLHGILCLIFSVQLIFFYQELLEPYDAEVLPITKGTLLTMRSYGILMLAVGIGFLYARNAAPSLGRKALLLIALLANLPTIFTYTHGILTGVQKADSWLLVGICSILAATAGWAFFNEKEAL
jgi:hypothetical protein